METKEIPPRIVDTPAELDALPIGAVATDVMGITWKKEERPADVEWEGYPTSHLIRRGPLAVTRMPL